MISNFSFRQNVFNFNQWFNFHLKRYALFLPRCFQSLLLQIVLFCRSCWTCSKNITKNAIVTNLGLFHSGIKIYLADYSNQTYATSTMMENCRPTKFTCEHCAKRFASKYDLTVHVRIHTGDKPYICAKCRRAFTQRGHLKRHTVVHGEEWADIWEQSLKLLNQTIYTPTS